MKERVHITTIDNPFNPFQDFASWYDFDMEKGYCSCQRVARLANITDDMTEIEIEEDPLAEYHEVEIINSEEVFGKWISTDGKTLLEIKKLFVINFIHNKGSRN